MNFETVYIEEDTKEDKNTIDILERIKFKNLVYCNSYSEIFNPQNQNFRIQKNEPFKLIIFIYLQSSYELVCRKNKTKRRIQGFEFF